VNRGVAGERNLAGIAVDLDLGDVGAVRNVIHCQIASIDLPGVSSM
jgi:hypothetical protein